MHFAEDRGGVTGSAQLAGQGGLVLAEGGCEHGHPGRVGHQAGEKRLAGRRADRRVAI